jgi:hypothetical protein
MDHLIRIAMQEIFLQYLWNHKMYENVELTLTDGTAVDVVFPGIWNKNSGPDFFNARIRIGDELWAGNVEIHYRSSDWFRHGHQADPAYQNIILHVVTIDDREVLNEKGAVIPCLKLDDDFNLYPFYRHLVETTHWVACEQYLPFLNPEERNFWLYRIGVERLEEKSKRIEEWLKASKNNWEEGFYHLLASSFGQKVNAIPFEMLARSIPLNLVHHLRDRPFSLYAIFFGQSGLLTSSLFLDDYQRELVKEYQFLKNKYHLVELPGHLWKLMRLRPKNFPGIRIAQFVAFLLNTKSLMNWALESSSIKDYLDSMRHPLPEYWETHYVFGKETPRLDKSIGEQAMHGVILNALVPLIFVYGEYHDRPDLKEKAVQIMEALPGETNADLDRWNKLGVNSCNAFFSQALLHLKKNYCDAHLCLQCRWGDQIIRLNSSKD